MLQTRCRMCFANLGKLKKRIKIDHNLALELWNSGNVDSMTLATMVALVTLSAWGIGFKDLGRLERYVHAGAGAMICLSGLSIRFLEW